MSPKWQAVFYILAVVLFLIDAYRESTGVRRRPGLQSLALACAVFPLAYGAAVAGW